MRLVPLGEVCEFLDHLRRPVAEELRRPGPYPYYGANGQQGWIDGFIFDETLVLLAEDGGHFGSRTRPIAYKVTGKTWVNNHAHVLRPVNGCDPDYLTHVLSFLDVSKLITGTTRPKLTKAKAEEIRIPLPSMGEQQRIATLFHRADRLRRMRRYALELSDTLLPAVFLEMFGDSLRETPEWPRVPVSELCESIIDCVNKTAPVVAGPTPYKMIRTSNVRGGRVSLEKVSYVDRETFERWTRRSIPRRGDVILTREAPLGEAGIIDSDDQIFLGQRLVQYRVDPRKATSQYVLHALMSPDVQEQLHRLGAGSTVEHVAVPECEALGVLAPPLRLQERFSEAVRHAECLHRQAREAVRQADHLFQSLLHRAFTAAA